MTSQFEYNGFGCVAAEEMAADSRIEDSNPEYFWGFCPKKKRFRTLRDNTYCDMIAQLLKL